MPGTFETPSLQVQLLKRGHRLYVQDLLLNADAGREELPPGVAGHGYAGFCIRELLQPQALLIRVRGNSATILPFQ